MTLLRRSVRDAVLILSLDDPPRRNALSVELCAEMVDAVADAESDPAIGAIVVTGEAPAFCAGADLSELGDSQHEGLRTIYSGFLAVADCSLPTVAAVNGAAVGAGMNLALACDVRVAGHSARFDTRFLDLGIHPGGGHTWLLSRLVGPQAAAAMVLFSEVLDAEQAEARGLVWRRFPDADLIDEAASLAAAAAAHPRDLSIRTKATLAAVAALDDHAAAVDAELEVQVWSINQPAFADRLAALRKRISSD